jgi:hypothetical protein
MPTIVTIVLCLLIFDETLFTLLIIWLIPFILSGLFFLVASSQSILKANLDISSLVAINLFCSIIYLVIFFLIAKLVSKDDKKTSENHKHTPTLDNNPSHAILHSQPSTIQEYIASIEDKSKALNFVIGRVYNKYHGGSKHLREKLSLKPEWYNEFSETLNNDATPDRRRLLSVLDNIEKQLSLMTSLEKEILTQDQLVELKNLQRDEYGNDKIIDVLITNDKDPVKSYYDGAKEFCLKLRDILQ